MATTARGWPYVVGSDTVTSYPTTSQAIADKLEVAAPFAMAAGSVACTSPGANSGTGVAVTFPVGRFTQPPNIQAIADSNGYLATSVASGPTASGFTARVYAFAVPPTGINVKWLAVQMTPSSGSG